MTEPGFKPISSDAKAYTFTQESGNRTCKKRKSYQKTNKQTNPEVMEPLTFIHLALPL